MGVANILFGLIIITGVVVGSIFAVNYYSTQSASVDTYGNVPTAANNLTTDTIVNASGTGTQAESALVIFIAVLFVFGIISLYVFKR